MGIDHCQASARRLFQRHPLDWRPIHAGSPLRVHLAIVGLDDMGKCVLEQAARIGHFANARRLRVTVFDPDAPRREARAAAALLPRSAGFAISC